LEIDVIFPILFQGHIRKKKQYNPQNSASATEMEAGIIDRKFRSKIIRKLDPKLPKFYP
jgi:hypothetical protein